MAKLLRMGGKKRESRTEQDAVGSDLVKWVSSRDGFEYGAQVVMVGDYRFDLECGRAAGTRTLLVNAPDNPWPGMACWHLADCRQVLETWQRP